MTLLEIYRKYKAAGLTDAGFYGLWGNFLCESGGISYRLQGDFSAGYSKSKAYTEAVDNGVISRYEFINNGPNGGGYGLAQWTFKPRKASYYDFCKKRKCSIGDMEAAVDFSIQELKTLYPGVLQTLKRSGATLAECVKIVCDIYENPAIKNYTDRYKQATKAKEELTAALAAEEKKQQAEKPPKTDYWPPRMLGRGMSGADVFALQGILCARGYYKAEINGVYDDRVEAAVRKFQEQHKLDADGVCGPLTWTELLKKTI